MLLNAPHTTQQLMDTASTTLALATPLMQLKEVMVLS
jgi:hypothetical protein